MHVIRLRGPWRATVVHSDSPNIRQPFESTDRQLLPGDWGDWLGREFLGTVRYERTFRTPTGLHVGQKVWLVVSPSDWQTKVSLNGELLGEIEWGSEDLRVAVGERIGESNRVELVVALRREDLSRRPAERIKQAGGPVGLVRLEIEEDEPV